MFTFRLEVIEQCLDALIYCPRVVEKIISMAELSQYNIWPTSYPESVDVLAINLCTDFIGNWNTHNSGADSSNELLDYSLFYFLQQNYDTRKNSQMHSQQQQKTN